MKKQKVSEKPQPKNKKGEPVRRGYNEKTPANPQGTFPPDSKPKKRS